MNIKSLFTLAAVVVLLASCSSGDEQHQTTIPFVRSILSDKACDGFRMLSGHSDTDPNADICIFGSEGDCIALAEAMASMDRRDNINGAGNPDGLLDFSGETISCIIDTMSAQYGGMLKSRKEYLVRERAVRIAMSAVDTMLHLSPYDLEGMGFKNSAKVLVAAGTDIAKYGMFDIDTLFRGTGCSCPVISPAMIMMDEALSEERPVSIGILSDTLYTDSDAYSECFNKALQSHRGVTESEYVVLPAKKDSTGTIKAFLDDYMASGCEKPLDVIMVNDLSLDIDELKSELAMLISIMNEESMVYGKLISDNFRFLDPASSLTRWVYNYLREENLFTHNIYRPQIITYIPVVAQDESNSILLIPGNHYVQN